MQLVTYQQLRQEYNPYNNFTGQFLYNFPSETLLFIYNMIDTKFKNRFLGSDQDDFKNYLYLALKENEYNFFNEFLKTYLLNLEEIDKILRGENIVKTKGSGLSSSTSSSENSGNYSSNSTSNNNNKSRVIGSVFPNSNVNENLTTDLDFNFKWNFATNATDSYNKSNVDSSDTGNNSSTTSARSNNDFSNLYERTTNKINVDELGKLIDFFNRESCFTKLFEKLEPLFLYNLKGLEKIF